MRSTFKCIAQCQDLSVDTTDKHLTNVHVSKVVFYLHQTSWFLEKWVQSKSLWYARQNVYVAWESDTISHEP